MLQQLLQQRRPQLVPRFLVVFNQLFHFKVQLLANHPLACNKAMLSQLLSPSMILRRESWLLHKLQQQQLLRLWPNCHRLGKQMVTRSTT